LHARLSLTDSVRMAHGADHPASSGDPRQLAVGIVVGIAFAGFVDSATGATCSVARAVWLLPTVALVMIPVGAVAALGAARTGQRIQPTEALKSE
jgi:hypothetical protein